MAHPLEYGLDCLGIDGLSNPPLQALLGYVREQWSDTEAFYSAKAVGPFHYKKGVLTFPSPVVTETPQNNTAVGRVTEAPDSRRAVIILPHWNAVPRDYARMSEWLRRFGISSIRMSMPYHDRRRAERAALDRYMVSANLGRTIRSVRQAVIESRLAIDWLQQRGYTEIGVIGTSLGTAIGSILAAHEPRVKALVLLLLASRFAEVVWTGRATRHIQSALDASLTREQLNEVWSIISPLHHAPRLGALGTPVLAVSAADDDVFEPRLARESVEAFEQHHIPYQFRTLPCGHYTIGTFPYNLWAMAYLMPFLQQTLK